MFEWAEFGHHLNCEDLESSDYTCDELNIIAQTMKICTFISFLCSSFVMCLYCYFRHERVMKKFAFHVIFFVVLMDLIYEISILSISHPAAHDYDPTCIIAGCLAQFAAISSNLWMLVISYTIYDSTRGYKTWVPGRIGDVHTAIWTIAFTSTCLPLTTNSYGPAGGWCWLKQESTFDVIWRFVVFYVPTCIIMFSVIYMLFWIMKDFGFSNPIVRRMGIFPALVIFGWSIGTINRTVQLFRSDIWQLALAHATTMGLHGTANCVIFLSTPGIRKLLGYCPSVEMISKSRSETSTSGDWAYSYTAFADGEDDIEFDPFDTDMFPYSVGEMASISISNRNSSGLNVQSTTL